MRKLIHEVLRRRNKWEKCSKDGGNNYTIINRWEWEEPQRWTYWWICSCLLSVWLVLLLNLKPRLLSPPPPHTHTNRPNTKHRVHEKLGLLLPIWVLELCITIDLFSTKEERILRSFENVQDHRIHFWAGQQLQQICLFCSGLHYCCIQPHRKKYDLHTEEFSSHNFFFNRHAIST